ncbi:hypothetical protein CRUP_020836, partial [Coryphaenoides rupestris]
MSSQLTPLCSQLARRYGNVYSLLFGCQKVVILNGFQAVKEALVTKAARFSGRPQDLMTNDAVQRKVDAPGMFMSNDNPQWKDHRRFGLSTLRNMGLGKKSMEERILRETERVEKILEEGVLFHNLASNVISRVVFGPEYDHNHDFIKMSIEKITENSKIINGPWALAVKEALVTKAARFSGRPQDLMTNDAVQRKADAPGVFLSNDTPQWRDHRRFALSTLRNMGLGKKSMEERILRETERVEKILEEGELFHNLASNVISRVIFGSEYDHNHDFIKLSIDGIRENAKILNGPWAL